MGHDTLASSLEVINNFFNLYNQEVTRTILSPTLFLYFLEKVSGYIKWDFSGYLKIFSLSFNDENEKNSFKFYANELLKNC